MLSLLGRRGLLALVLAGRLEEIPNRLRYRKHGGGAAAAAAAGGVTTVYAADTFTRADGAIGTAETGGPWTSTPDAVWRVLSNQARISAATSPIEQCYIDDGQADGWWFADYVVLTNTGLMIRRVDDTTFIGFKVAGAGEVHAYRVTAGVFTSIMTGGDVVIAGDQISVNASGAAVDVYLNGVLTGSFSETQGQSSTQSGLFSQNNTGRVDNYVHRSTQAA